MYQAVSQPVDLKNNKQKQSNRNINKQKNNYELSLVKILYKNLQPCFLIF